MNALLIVLNGMLCGALIGQFLWGRKLVKPAPALDVTPPDDAAPAWVSATIAPVSPTPDALAISLELVGKLIDSLSAALANLTSPGSIAVPNVDLPPSMQRPTLADVDYDPTDNDQYLGVGEYAPFVPRQFANDAPAPITHPLGVPGLQVPYQPQPTMDDYEPTMVTSGYMSTNGTRDFDVVTG